METTIYTADDLIRVAKRVNNTKRSFLYVDPLQGKHIPVSPGKALAVFDALAERVHAQYGAERLLVIGFAETATAIGNALACRLPQAAAFLTTTRENLADTEFLYFTESHSHAAEQRLAANGIADWLPQIDRIVFAEDEVTTGNTIAKLIGVMRERFPEYPLRFGIASLLNSMTDERLADFAAQGIPCSFLVRIPFGYRIHDADAFTFSECTVPRPAPEIVPQIQKLSSGWNPRRIADIAYIRSVCADFADRASAMIAPQAGERILVLGTEECMYAGLTLGNALEQAGADVRFHATTRSPIAVSADENYPLHVKYALLSLYDAARQTFIYNLTKYDRVIIVTDAAPICQAGLRSLTDALADCGNTNLTLLQWSDAT